MSDQFAPSSNAGAIRGLAAGGDGAAPGKDPVDEASAESMIASDPPAYGGVRAVGAPAASADGEERREATRRRAHALWEAAGRPGGDDVRFWLQAERELAGEHRPT